MDLVNCSRCGRWIKDSDGDDVLCSKCLKIEGDPYKLVREYIYNNQGATVIEVSEATGISKSLILKYLKDGRLSLMEQRSLLPHCDKCGIVIEKGSICGKCLKQELEGKEKNQPQNKTGISSFGRRRRR